MLAWAASFPRFLDHTQWNTAVGRTSLDGWSARRRDLYLTNTQHSKETNIYDPAEFKTSIPAGERPNTLALDGPAFGIGNNNNNTNTNNNNNNNNNSHFIM